MDSHEHSMPNSVLHPVSFSQLFKADKFKIRYCLQLYNQLHRNIIIFLIKKPFLSLDYQVLFALQNRKTVNELESRRMSSVFLLPTLHGWSARLPCNNS